MRQSIKFVQKSIDPKPSIVDMIKAYTVLIKHGVHLRMDAPRAIEHAVRVESSSSS